MSIRAEERRRVFRTLDLLRGVAALSVVARHLDGRLNSWLPGSHLAVDLFFLLSGLVVCHAYEHRIVDGGLGAAAFFRLRLIRLYPLYLLGSLGVLALVLMAKMTGRGVPIAPPLLAWPVVFAALFLPTPAALSFDKYHVYPLNFPAWSLFWELFVNLAYALIARWLNARTLAAILAVGAVSIVATSRIHHGLDTGSNFGTFLSGLPRVLFAFFAGVAIEHLRARGSLPSFSLPAAASVAMLLGIFALRPAGAAAAYDAIAVLVALPMLVIASLGDPPRRMIRLSAALGTASYAIYALQTPVLKIAEQAMRGRTSHAGIAWELAFLALMLGLGLVVDRCYDVPARAWLFRRSVAARRTPHT